jgi:class 3 adenylate cyclase
MDEGGTGTLHERATQALGRHEWRAAFDLLSDADAREALAGDDLELLAQAAWWTGQLPAAIGARERAYAGAVKAGDIQTAVIAAVSLARDNLFRMSTTVANAWLNRAERLLQDVPDQVGHGWLAGVRSFHAALVGESDDALRYADRALDFGRRFGDRNLEALGLSEKSAALLSMGRVEEGLPLADEATLAAVSGELDPQTAGGVCCATIEACAGIGDLKRAAEWTEAQDRWCRREGINGYPGMCRVFRSDVKRLRGAWSEAEAEARLASDELRGFVPAGAGLALNLIGEIKLSRGDLPAAEEALLGAHALGTDVEPVFSLLRLAQGRLDAATDSIRRALDEPGRQPSWQAPPDSAMYRLRLLPARVQIALASGDATTAREAADELARIAETFGTVAARAAAATATGQVTLVEGDAVTATRFLRDAVGLWTELDAPYDEAKSRMGLADAYRARQEDDLAAVELRVARDAFERLGAVPDQRRAEALLAELQVATGSEPMGMTASRVVRAFMFTDIVDSTRLAVSLGDEAWRVHSRSHDQALRSAAAEQGGEEVKATGDGFFFTFADADAAIEAAIAMQRRLDERRRGEGFAPDVRIGIHLAEASRVGLDYQGLGVNVASRIADRAEAGEILVSGATLGRARHRFTTGTPRTVELKGVSDPMELTPIDWR